MDLFGMGIQIDYRDNASQGLSQTAVAFNNVYNSAQHATNGLESKLTSLSLVSSGVGQVGSTLSRMGEGIMGSLKGATDQATSFQSELNQLKFITGATGEEFERLRRVAVQTGIDTAFSPQEATQAMYELKSAGLSTNDMLKSLQATLDLVAVSGGKIQLGEGASLVASTLKKFNLDASESIRVVNQLSQASKVSNFHFEDFSAFMNSLQSAPSTLKRPLEEFLAVGGMLRNVGQGAAQAGATVNGFGRQLVVLTRQLENKAKLQKRTSAQMKFNAMAEMGLDKNTIWDSTGALRPLNEILTSLITQMANMSDQKRAVISQTLFGDQAKNLLFAVDGATKSMLKYDEATGKYVMTTKDGKMNVNDMTNAIRDSNGVAEEGADTILKSAWGINKLWEGSKQTFQILLGQTILPIIGRFIQGMTKVLNVIIAFLDKHPLFAKVLGLGTGITGLFLLATGGILKFVSTLGMAIAGAGMFMITLGQFGMMFTGASSLAMGFGNVMMILGTKLRALFMLIGKGTLVVGGLYLAWKTDFLGIRSLLQWFMESVHTAFSESTRIAGLGVDLFKTEIERLSNSDSLFDKFILGLVKVKVFWQGLCDAWNDYTLSDENFKKLNELGLIPLLSTILDLKRRFEAFWTGFKEGWADVSAKVVEGVKTIMGWIDKLGQFFKPTKDKMVEVNQVIGETDFSGWKDFGNTMAYVVSILGGLMVISKIGGVIMSVGSMVLSVGRGILSVVKLISSGIGFVLRLIPMLLGAIGTAVTTILGAVGVVVSLPAWLVGLIAVAITTVVVLVVKYWTQIKEFLLGVCEAIGDFFSSLGEGICEGVSWLVDTISGFVTGLWDDICNGASWLYETVAGFFSKLWDGICKGAEWAWNGIVAIMTPVINFFSGLFEMIVGFGEIAWSVIKGACQISWAVMEGIVLLFWEGLKAIATPVIEFLTWAWEGISSSAQYCWEQITSFTTWAWEGIVSIVQWAVDGIVGFVTWAWQGISSSAQWCWEQVTSIVTWAWNGIVSVAQWAWNGIVATWNTITSFFQMIWNFVYNNIVIPVWNGIVAFITWAYQGVVAVWNGIVAFFSALWNGVKAVAIAIWNGILNFISSVCRGVKSVWSSITGFFSGLWNGIRSLASSIWAGIKNVITRVIVPIKNAWSGVKGFFSDLWNGIKESASALFDWLASKFEWVSNIASKIAGAWQGIKDGASSGWEKVKTGAKKMVGLSTGGYVKTEGVAMLHPNEVVVNAPLTRRLDEFLMLNQRLMARPPEPIVAPVEKPEPKTYEGKDDKEDKPFVILNDNDDKGTDDNPRPRGFMSFFRVPTNNDNPRKDNPTPVQQNDNRVVFEEGAIQIKVEKGDMKDAQQFAQRIMDEIKRKQDLDRIREYKPI